MKCRSRSVLARCAMVLAGLALATSLSAQSDTAKMKHDEMMKDDKMMKSDKMMDHDMMGSHGSFSGRSGHMAGGSYQIAMEGGKQWVKLGDDFSLDKAPDPYVVISPTDKGADARALNLGKLRNLKGAQVYEIPAGSDLSAFHHVIIYCKKLDATLGIAELAVQGAMMHN